MYQALYRKYRPGTFDDVVGQEHVTKTLRRQIETGRLSHAYLFVGTRGTGKTTCARILAKAANCEHPVNGNPCNECASCRGIDSGAILDVEELDAASNSSVDNIRALRDEAVYSPAAVRKRVYIVDEVHMLSAAAFNTLLKILEEPPEHIIFILATTEIGKVLPTILSRCQRFTFRRLTPPEISGRLLQVAKAEGLDLAPEAADMLARMADGGMRDGLSLLDQCVWDGPIDLDRVTSAIGLVGAGDTEDLLRCVIAGDASAALERLGALYAAGKSLESVLSELCTLLRDILVWKVAPGGGIGLLSGAHGEAELADSAKHLSNERLLFAVDEVQRTLTELSRVADKRTAAEVCLIRLCRPELSPEPEALLERIQALESGAVRSGQERGVEPIPPVRPAPMPKTQPVPASVRIAPDPAPEPVPPPDPAPAVPERETKTPVGDLWQAVLQEVAPKLGMPDSMFLTDTGHTRGSYSGGVLTLEAKTALASGVLKRTDTAEAIRTAASRIAGSPVVVRVTEGGGTAAVPAEDKLDRLSRFGNVTMT